MARRIALLFGFIALFGLASVSADEIYLKGRPPLKNATITAESPKGITVSGGDKYAEADIESVFFDKVDGLVALTYGQAYKSEKTFLDTSKDAKARANAYADAKVKYDDLVGKMPDKRSKAHIEFTIGYMMGQKALEDGTDPKNAIVRLNEFVKANPQSWQLVRSLSMLAKLHESTKDYANAKGVYTQLAGLDVPEEIKQNAHLQVAMADVRLGKYADAEPKLANLLKTMPKDSAVYARTQLAQAECLLAGNKTDEAMAILKKTVKDSPDKALKAVAHNALGVNLYNAEKYKEARWEFLWVDVVYNTDKAEHAKALYYLTHLEEKLGETPKADECREQLLSDKSFAGTEYQRKMQKERCEVIAELCLPPRSGHAAAIRRTFSSTFGQLAWPRKAVAWHTAASDESGLTASIRRRNSTALNRPRWRILPFTSITGTHVPNFVTNSGSVSMSRAERTKPCRSSWRFSSIHASSHRWQPARV